MSFSDELRGFLAEKARVGGIVLPAGAFNLAVLMTGQLHDGGNAVGQDGHLHREVQFFGEEMAGASRVQENMISFSDQFRGEFADHPLFPRVDPASHIQRPLIGVPSDVGGSSVNPLDAPLIREDLQASADRGAADVELFRQFLYGHISPCRQ